MPHYCCGSNKLQQKSDASSFCSLKWQTPLLLNFRHVVRTLMIYLEVTKPIDWCSPQTSVIDFGFADMVVSSMLVFMAQK